LHEELDIPADGVDVATGAGGVRQGRPGTVAHGYHANRSEDLAADVVPVSGGEAGLGDGDGPLSNVTNDHCAAGHPPPTEVVPPRLVVRRTTHRMR
jgi:hypothetical protein